jgi:ferric-dicitrate binding protein FerR (iron transport regulator)
MEKKFNIEDCLEGKQSLEEIWEGSKGEASPVTFRELVRLGKRIDAAEARRRLGRTVWTVFAAAASVAVVALVTFSLTRSKYSVTPLESTCNLVANYGQTSSITLEDGTKVSLNAGSSLLYPKSFDGDNRIVYLSGEGNFNVAKDPSRPFIVKTAYMDVQALGTSFCVQSYTGERTMRTTLKEGKVKVSVPAAGEKSYILDPGMQLIYRPSKKSVALARVDAEKVMSWEEGFLTFSNASFPEIASALERRFDVSISYSSENLRRSALNVRFMPDETLEDALDVLTLLIPESRYKVDGSRVYFRF